MSTCRKVRMTLIALAVAALLPLGSAVGGDWPQFRCDAGRTAACDEQLPAELSPHWVRQYAPPKPVFPGEIRLRFDASYEPVVAGKTIFVPSMVTDTVAALDTDTGNERWRFFADGPVRFAPVVWQDKVYFVCDDGYLYCVGAADGKLRWKFRGLPAEQTDRKLLGNGRLISLSPARGGPVLADGIVYFAAGVWPTSGIFVHAVDAATGKAVWSNVTSHHMKQTNLDHGVRSPAGLTPNGYLAVTGERLVVPCGTQLPAFFDRKLGKIEPYTTGWGGRVGLPKGSWFAAATGNYLITSGDLYDVSRPNDEESNPNFKSLLYAGSYTRLQIDPGNQKDLAPFRRPVLTSDAMFYNTHDGAIAACDLTQGKMEARSKDTEPAHRRNDQYPDKWHGAFAELWRTKSKLKVHIKAGSRLYAGGPGVIEAIEIPKESSEAKVSWRATIEGTPSRMLAADGKLFVVTLQGRVYAFGERRDAKAVVHRGPKVAPAAKADRWTKTAAAVLKETNATDGYALVLGAGTGRLAEELVRQSKLDAIVIEADAEKVAALRDRFHKAGLYGTRISICPGDPMSYPLPPYLASLIVSEDPAAVADSFDRAFARRVIHPLRPYGGTACLTMPATHRDALAKEIVALNVPSVEVQQTDTAIVLSRTGPLPGAADYSHDGADAGNSGAPNDRFLKPPLSLLWFDGSRRWLRTHGTVTVRVAGGRVLVRDDTLYAMDVFTGRRLWEIPLPFSVGALRRGDIVAADDGVYVTGGNTCAVFNPADGKELRRIKLPDVVTLPAAGGWTNLRVAGDHLVATSGANVVCVDRRSGQPLWQFRAKKNRLGLALGGGKVFCAELPAPADRQGRRPPGDKSRTLALDVNSGKLLWEMPQGGVPHYSPEHDLLVVAGGTYRAADATLVHRGTTAWCVAGDRTLCGDVENLQTFNLLTGDKAGEPVQWSRRGCTSIRASRNLVTTRSGGNASYLDLATGQITPLWGVRSGCNNNLMPADGVLNLPNLTGGCTCHYTPMSLALVPTVVIQPGTGEE
ncbi:MAG: PQQ-binding-like beta-propeller repeat protein [Candidatus Nealsonbacteria bacterium]|nr:PQQ-binding-like beta-propeller repeat protein [Candidatus Nealsonbacteria bacterium]